MHSCHSTLKPCTILSCTQPTNSKYQSNMLRAAKYAITVVSTWTTCKKIARYGGFLCALQTLNSLHAWTLTLSETAHNNPLNKTSHTRVLHRPRPGIWKRGQKQIFHPGCFSALFACCGFFVESRSAPLRIGKSSERSHLPVCMVDMLEKKSDNFD